MPRIRTIKPEFPQSESMGRVSRDARLLFIQLWPICDDSGRARGTSRMLASLLFPYDEDAGSLIDGWLAELEREDCVRRYRVGNDTYIQVMNWQKHQKIDKPSESKIPPFDEASRIVAEASRKIALDQGPRTKEGIKDQGSVPNGTAPDGAVDLKAAIFDSGLRWLTATSKRSDASCRSLLGKWLGIHGDEAVLAVLASAQRQGAIEPVSWIEAAFRERSPPKGRKAEFN